MSDVDEAIGYRTATRFWGYYVVERFLSITHFSVLLEPADDTKQVLETRKHERVSATDVTTVQTRQIEDKNIYPHTNKGEKKVVSPSFTKTNQNYPVNCTRACAR